MEPQEQQELLSWQYLITNNNWGRNAPFSYSEVDMEEYKVKSGKGWEVTREDITRLRMEYVFGNDINKLNQMLIDMYEQRETLDRQIVQIKAQIFQVKAMEKVTKERLNSAYTDSDQLFDELKIMSDREIEVYNRFKEQNIKKDGEE